MNNMQNILFAQIGGEKCRKIFLTKLIQMPVFKQVIEIDNNKWQMALIQILEPNKAMIFPRLMHVSFDN